MCNRLQFTGAAWGWSTIGTGLAAVRDSCLTPDAGSAYTTSSGKGFPSMKQVLAITFAFALLCGPGAIGAFGQASNVGSVSVTVLDPAGATIAGANLELKDIATNDLRRAQTS